MAAMAPPPQRFGAHDCYTMGACHLEQLVDAFSKLGAGHVIGVPPELVVASAWLVSADPVDAARPGSAATCT
jgi:hypothetical protein